MSEKITEEIENLKKEIAYITKTLIPKISSGSNEWKAIYDKASTDPLINLGYLDGLRSNLGTLESLPDLSPFKKIKFHLKNYDDVSMFEFDLENRTSCRFSHPLTGSTGIFICETVLQTIEGKKTLQIKMFKEMTFYSTKYTRIIEFSSYLEHLHIAKIEVC